MLCKAIFLLQALKEATFDSPGLSPGGYFLRPQYPTAGRPKKKTDNGRLPGKVGGLYSFFYEWNSAEELDYHEPCFRSQMCPMLVLYYRRIWRFRRLTFSAMGKSAENNSWFIRDLPWFAFFVFDYRLWQREGECAPWSWSAAAWVTGDTACISRVMLECAVCYSHMVSFTFSTNCWEDNLVLSHGLGACLVCLFVSVFVCLFVCFFLSLFLSFFVRSFFFFSFFFLFMARKEARRLWGPKPPPLPTPLSGI